MISKEFKKVETTVQDKKIKHFIISIMNSASEFKLMFVVLEKLDIFCAKIENFLKLKLIDKKDLLPIIIDHVLLMHILRLYIDYMH